MNKTPGNHLYNCLAITGGIGSGKSTVLNYFKEHGFLTVSADDLVEKLYSGMFYYSTELFSKIDKEFNTNFYSLGFVDKNILRVIINVTPNGLKTIADITAPYINKAIEDTFNTHKNFEKIIFEIPLLVEQEQHHKFKKVLVVYADLEVKIQRILKRNPNLTKEEINQRINTQLTDKDKLNIADYKINNSKDILFLYKQLDMILNDIVDIYK